MFNQSGDPGGFEFLDLITIVSFVMQVSNYQELKKQTTTDDIYRELRLQDREYLDKIVENQKIILSKLEEIQQEKRKQKSSPQG